MTQLLKKKKKKEQLSCDWKQVQNHQNVVQKILSATSCPVVFMNNYILWMCRCWQIPFFFFALQVLEDEQVLYSFFFFLYSHVTRANVYESWDTVPACVCSGGLDAALTLSWFVSSVLFTSQSPQKRREKNKCSRQRDEQQHVEAAFESPNRFSPQLILSFSPFFFGCLSCLEFMTHAS